MRTNIVIIGAGRLGKAMAGILRLKNLTVELWDIDKSKSPARKNLAEIIPSADFLFLSVPSWHARQAIASFYNFLRKRTIVISPSKGIEAKSRKTMDELLLEILPPGAAFALMGGPMLSEELETGGIGAAAIGTNSKKIFKELKKLFSGTNIKLEYFSDIRGVALGGVLKNVYAVGLGIASALSWSTNAKGWFAVHALQEMAQIAKILGGRKQTIYSLAGLGDLVATGFSPHSRNWQTGNDLVKTGKCCIKSEGLIALPTLVKLLGRRAKQFKLFDSIKQIVLDGKSGKTIFEDIIEKLDK